MRVVAIALVAIALGAACAGEASSSRMDARGLDPDELAATADADAVAKVAMCKSTFDDVKHVLGEPYRDGFAHGLKVRTWKIKPANKRKAEPAAIAFNVDEVVVDVCYDLPGAAHCDFADRCPRS
jgi:hypothetical protein